MATDLIEKLISEIDFDSLSDKSSKLKFQTKEQQKEEFKKIARQQILNDLKFKKLEIFKTDEEIIYFGDIIHQCNFSKCVFSEIINVENDRVTCAATFMLPFQSYQNHDALKTQNGLECIPIYEIFVNILFYAWFYYFEPHELYLRNILEFQFAIVKQINMAINIMTQNGSYFDPDKMKSKFIHATSKKKILKPKELKPFFTNVIGFKSKHWPVFFDQYLKIPNDCDASLKSQIESWNENVNIIRKFLPIIQKQSLFEITKQRDQVDQEYRLLQSHEKSTSSMFE